MDPMKHKPLLPGEARLSFKIQSQGGPEERLKASQELLHILHSHQQGHSRSANTLLEEQQLAHKVTQLLQSGAQVNCQDANLNTPLHIVASAGYAHVAT